jgi:hypothetical protein
MNKKYLPLFWDLRQWRAVLWRIHINIFGIFFKIPLLPLGFDKIGFDFYYKGDTLIWSWKQKRWISVLYSGTGEFGDACFDTLKDYDNFGKELDSVFWDEKEYTLISKDK